MYIRSKGAGCIVYHLQSTILGLPLVAGKLQELEFTLPLYSSDRVKLLFLSTPTIGVACTKDTSGAAQKSID